MRRRLAMLLALTSGGCFAAHAVEVPAEASTPGRRLRVIEWVPEGAPGFLGGLFDTELEVDCAWAPTEGGGLRCLPSHVRPARYADPGCETPVVARAAVCDVALLSLETVEREADACEPGRSVFRAYRPGEPVTLERTFERRDGACVPASGEAGERLPVEHLRLERVPDDAFVGGAREVAPAPGDRLGSEQIVGEDGSTFWVGHHDLERGEACVPRYARSGDIPCLPSDTSGSVLCGGRYVVSRLDGCGRAPELFVDEVPPATFVCDVPEAVRVYRAGAEAEPAAALACAGYSPGGTPFHAERADDEVPWIPNERRGDGRLVREPVAPSGAASFAVGLYWDRDLGVPCNPTVVEGKLRCAPVTYGTVTDGRFSDPSCTLPAADARFGSDPCSSYVTLDLGGCGGRRYFEVDGPIPVYWVREADGSCTERRGGTGMTPQGLRAVDPDAFASFRRVLR